MANERLSGPSSPDDFPQVQPTELFPTNNIRFVMYEVAKLEEKTLQLTKAVEKQETLAQTLADRHSAAISKSSEGILKELKEALRDQNDSLKERIDAVKEAVKEVKDSAKDIKDELDDIGRKVAFVKGVSWVFGGIFVILVAIVGAMARKLF